MTHRSPFVGPRPLGLEVQDCLARARTGNEMAEVSIGNLIVTSFLKLPTV
jgi:hypothetical protein